MTLTTTALALYHRTKAQFHSLIHPTALLRADHNHSQRPYSIAFPTHRTPGLRRRRNARPLTKAIRHLLTAYSPGTDAAAPAAPDKPAVRRLAPPSPTPPVPQKPPCRLCAATAQPSPTPGKPS